MNHPLASYLKRFFSHYLPVQKGLSPHTLAAYRDAVKLLLGYLADTLKLSVDALSVEAITAARVSDFLDHLEQVRGCRTSTRNARLAAIRSLFAFIAREEPVLMPQCQAIRAIPLKRAEHNTVEYLEESEMQAVLNAVDTDARTGVRDRALLMVLYNTGARVSEIVGLAPEDLRLDGACAQVKLPGKGRKPRSCPLWPETAEALKAYLQQRQPVQPATEQVFLNANGLPITRFGIRYVTRKYGARALPPSRHKVVNPHSVRHTTAMHLLRAGNDINMVSFWLGHADINTTHIYVEIDMEMKRKMIANAEAPAVDSKTPWQRPDILSWLRNITKRPELCGVNG
ncbi:MAG: site-specific integrase [Gammaproteobacteria bacterium]|nr:site-specific integrase [Gammaproteobacteria bacterium]